MISWLTENYSTDLDCFTFAIIECPSNPIHS